ncbi:MAG TPA: PAS domain S-box protein [Acidobacteriota bacterium]|nr:PAS domain S-box protein [Acidobacteriota bacterium]HMZ79637.1 PAS domain S-box protein [Acidobacteriota bacterium]HNB73824.1 PAS domain S-box protein [Acidobacteriota bacterium]HNC45552.1 PAS domain S-box protein [Acidobacteriota bacterium]HNG95238.1 PAS domain S-box protein [Acidobacteriota bacterium]
MEGIINSVADPIFVKDRTYRFVLLNDAFCEFSGHSREEMLGKTDFDFFPAHQAQIFQEKDEDVFLTGEENINEEELTDRAGNTHTIITKKTLHTTKAGEVLLVGVIRDVTELKRIEREREELIQKLQTALDEVKLLQGFLPICSYCKKIRQDENYWQQIEQYIFDHLGTQFSHSICPDCFTNIAQKELEQLRQRFKR